MNTAALVNGAPDRAMDEARLLHARCCFPLSLMLRLFRESRHTPSEVVAVVKQAIEDTCASGPPPDVAGQLIAEQIAVARGWKAPQKLKPFVGFAYDGSPEAEREFRAFLTRAETAAKIAHNLADHVQ